MEDTFLSPLSPLSYIALTTCTLVSETIVDQASCCTEALYLLFL